MGEIVSPAIAKLKELGESTRQVKLKELGESTRQVKLKELGELTRQAKLGEVGESTRQVNFRELGDPTNQVGLRESGSRIFNGSLRHVGALVPQFERKPIGGAHCHEASDHPHLDVLVCRASPAAGLIGVPVGVVTRGRQLVPHAHVIQAIERSLQAARANPAEAPCELELSGFGVYMRLCVDLPNCFGVDLGNEERLGLRLLCVNAIAGGGLRLLTCWNRPLSSSLIPVGATRHEFRLANRLPLRIADLAPTVLKAVEMAQAERVELALWRETLITRDQLVNWADGSVRRLWGPRIAARVFHIVMSGWDAEPAYGFERTPPSRRTMRATRPVPAVAPFAETAYDALLAAAWVANSERDVHERFDRVADIAALMSALLRRERGCSAR
jgi:hypothetical protein